MRSRLVPLLTRGPRRGSGCQAYAIISRVHTGAGVTELSLFSSAMVALGGMHWLWPPGALCERAGQWLAQGLLPSLGVATGLSHDITREAQSGSLLPQLLELSRRSKVTVVTVLDEIG